MTDWIDDGESGASVRAKLNSIPGSFQPSDSDLTAIALLTTTAFGRALLTVANAAALRTAAGLGTAAVAAVGDFQPIDADLTAIAALTTTAFGRSALELADAAALRTLAGLGSAALSASGDFQPADSDLTAIAALSTTAFGRSVLTQADAAALRTLAGLVIGTNVQAYSAILAAIVATGITTAMFAANVVDTDGTLAANSTTRLPAQSAVKTYVDARVAALVASAPGTLDTLDELAAALADDPNFATTMATALGNRIRVDAAQSFTGGEKTQARANIGAVIGTDVQAYDADLAAIAALTTATFGRSLLTLVDAAALRTAAGLGTAALAATGDFQPIDADLTAIAALTTTAYGRALLELANAAAVRSAAGLVIGTDVAAFSDARFGREVQLLVSDPLGDAITTGDGKVYFRVPAALNGKTLTAVAASLSTVSSSGIPTVQLRRVRAGTPADMLSTKLTIDATELDSSTAAAAAVIDGASNGVSTGDQIFVDIDVAGTGAKGLSVNMSFSV